VGAELLAYGPGFRSGVEQQVIDCYVKVAGGANATFFGEKFMKRITKILGASLLWACAVTAHTQPPAPNELDPQVAEAWQKANATVGWQKADVTVGWHVEDWDGSWGFSEAKPKDIAVASALTPAEVGVAGVGTGITSRRGSVAGSLSPSASNSASIRVKSARMR
jgi:hypothetical protein